MAVKLRVFVGVRTDNRCEHLRGPRL